MPKMYNPDTQETVDADGREVQEHKRGGFVTVGNRPEEEYVGKTREELEAENAGDAVVDLDATPEEPEAPEAPEEPTA